MDLTSKLQKIYSRLKDSRRILAIGHVSPDADALASVGAILELAKGLGAEAYGFAARKIEKAYDFIPNEDLVRSEEPDDLRVFETIIIMDCGSIARTGLESRLRELIKAGSEGRLAKRPYIIEIDHHVPIESYADLEVRFPDKASTTELLYHFFKANNIEISKTLANCILVGLLTDTGHFLHANSSKEALAIASEMLLRGASLPRIIDRTVNNKSFSSLKIWGRALENLQLDQTTGLAASGLTEKELKELAPESEAGLEADIFGDIVSYLSMLSGVRVALLLREEGKSVKGSMRTIRDDIDVARIAQNWGGGGHRKAAGFTVEGRLERTEKGWKIINNKEI